MALLGVTKVIYINSMLQATRFIGMPKHVRYYLGLQDPRRLRYLMYALKGKPLVYGIRNLTNNMIYVGSTLVPHDRFYQHLITGEKSNPRLQSAIDTHTLAKFTVLVFEFVDCPKSNDQQANTLLLRQVEQRYIDMFPKNQLYNDINAIKS